MVTTPVGALASDPHRQEAQLRQLLRDGLGTVMTNRATLRLRGAAVEAVAAAPSRVAGVTALRERIEDALHLADLHAATLAPGAARSAGASGHHRHGDAETLIFRI